MENILIAVLSILTGSILIPNIFKYIQTKNTLNHLLMEIISNKQVLFRYKSNGVKILDYSAWESTKSNEYLINLLINTHSPNVLHKITNAYQFSRSRAVKDTITKDDLQKCMHRYNLAYEALLKHLKSNKISYFFIPLYSHKRLIRLHRMFRR